MLRSKLLGRFWFMPLLDADGGSGGGTGGSGGGTGGAGDPGDGGGGSPHNPTQNQPLDYEKLASIIAGKQSVTEDTVLKSYFKQQGLSQDEMRQAIEAYKAEKAKNQPDAAALQQKADQASEQAKQANIEKEAVLEAVKLGIDPKTIPYVLKLADMSSVAGDDGKINTETLQNALKKVLEDVPAFKPSSEQNSGGIKIGAGGGSGGQGGADQDALKAVFGLS